MSPDQWFLVLSAVFIAAGLVCLRKEKTMYYGLAFCLVGVTLCLSVIVVTIANHWT